MRYPLIVIVLFYWLSLCCLELSSKQAGLEIQWNKQRNMRNHHTQLYRINQTGLGKEYIILRRDGWLEIGLVGISQQIANFSFRLQPIDIWNGSAEINNPPIDIPTYPAPYSPSQPSWYSEQRGDDFNIFVPPQANIGVFSLLLVNDSAPSGPTISPLHAQIVILLNPWSPNDTVYLPDENALNEYILNENGVTWMGSYNDYQSSGWMYSQFDQAVLEVTLHFLVGVPPSDRNDAVSISRMLSQRINVNNDGGGLVEGKWDPPYSDGVSPTDWQGSSDIYLQYKNTQSAVKYGQCWVFAGALTSAGRTLGIPSRTITNMASAHENGKNGVYSNRIDLFYDMYGNSLGMLGSIWNFHQWVEFWLNRNDITDASGWQVVDATPQERSFNGRYQVGPASVDNVKSNIHSIYDTPFVYSEVNAWLYKYVNVPTIYEKHPTVSGYWLFAIDTTSIGQKLLTKDINSWQPIDITLTYKGDTYTTINSISTTNNSFTLDILVEPSSDIHFGDDFNISLVLSQPDPSESRYLSVTHTVWMETSSGFLLKTILNNEENHIQLTRTHKHLNWTIHGHQYITPLPQEKPRIIISVFAREFTLSDNIVSYTGYVVHLSSLVHFLHPAVQFLLRPLSAHSLLLHATITNTGHIGLTGGFLTIAGIAIQTTQVTFSDLSPACSQQLNLQISFSSPPEVLYIRIKWEQSWTLQYILNNTNTTTPPPAN